MSPKLLVLENLSKYYTSTQSVVVGLNSIRLSFDTGEFVAITGESGSGKSTMALFSASSKQVSKQSLSSFSFLFEGLRHHRRGRCP